MHLVHQKWKYAHPQVIQDADEFVSSSYWRNVASHQCLSNGCSAVNVSPPDVKWWMWIIVMFYQTSFWRHPFTAEHPLLRHWCDATFLQIRRRNKLNYILDDPRVNTCSVNLHFLGQTIPLTCDSWLWSHVNKVVTLLIYKRAFSVLINAFIVG